MIVNDCADHGVLATHLQKLATRQVALKVQAQKKSVANAHLAPSSRSWRFKVVSPQLLSRVDAHWQEKRQKDSTPDKQNAKIRLRGGLSLISAHAVKSASLCTLRLDRALHSAPASLPRGNPGGIHTVRKMRPRWERSRGLRATLAGTRGGGWGVVSEKNDCEHNGPGQQQQPAQKKNYEHRAACRGHSPCYGTVATVFAAR